jgi:hypothetical protein
MKTATIPQEYDPQIDVSTIEEHPDNPRRGDDDAVGESISRNGFFGAILVQKSTNLVIAGNTRFRVMRDEGSPTIPGFWVDCDDETALRILLADNRTSDLAFYDDQQLFTLLKQLVDSEGLAGTGYDRAAFEVLLQTIESDSIVGGVRQGVLPEERIDAYNDLDMRSIILPYAGEQYEQVAGMMARLREAFDLETNADLVALLVTDSFNSVNAS